MKSLEERARKHTLLADFRTRDTAEFDEMVDSRTKHEILRRRKKQSGEPYLDFIMPVRIIYLSVPV